MQSLAQCSLYASAASCALVFVVRLLLGACLHLALCWGLFRLLHVLLCRLGARGVQAVAADPGAVRTNIYNNSPKLGKGFIKTMIDNCYAPPEDGAQVRTHAAVLGAGAAHAPWSCPSPCAVSSFLCEVHNVAGPACDPSHT